MQQAVIDVWILHKGKLFTLTIKPTGARFPWNKSSRVPGLLSPANSGTKRRDENSIVQKKNDGKEEIRKSRNERMLLFCFCMNAPGLHCLLKNN